MVKGVRLYSPDANEVVGEIERSAYFTRSAWRVLVHWYHPLSYTRRHEEVTAATLACELASSRLLPIPEGHTVRIDSAGFEYLEPLAPQPADVIVKQPAPVYPTCPRCGFPVMPGEPATVTNEGDTAHAPCIAAPPAPEPEPLAYYFTIIRKDHAQDDDTILRTWLANRTVTFPAGSLADTVRKTLRRLAYFHLTEERCADWPTICATVPNPTPTPTGYTVRIHDTTYTLIATH
jgi:hypothetical protein